MDTNVAIAVVMLVGVILVAAAFVVFGLRRRVPPVPPLDGEPVGVADSLDSVMRALTLVQHRYAALVRLYDDTQTRLRETEVERDHWKRMALGGRKTR